jgi:SAM-dependent methyltransferase
MDPSDPYGLGYHDVDGDPHTAVLVSNMDATSEWQATRRLRVWERQHLGLVDGERLLDVGCGLGDAAITLASDLGTTGELVGVDMSAAMLEVARRRSRDAPCAVRFLVGDARSLEQADDSFDVIRSERTLQWVPDPEIVVSGFARVLRPKGRLSLIDTDWSSLRLEVGDQEITKVVRDGLRVERNRPSNVGRRLAELAESAGLEVTKQTAETQTWTRWDPDESPAPDGCFSMTSLAEDLVKAGQLESGAVRRFVETIHEAARSQRFAMSLTMHAMVAVLR